MAKPDIEIRVTLQHPTVSIHMPTTGDSCIPTIRKYVETLSPAQICFDSRNHRITG